MTEALADTPRLRLDSRQESDVNCLSVGAFRPLRGFMGSADHQAVVSNMRLASGAIWPLPIILAVNGLVARGFRAGEDIVLLGSDGEPLAVLALSEVFQVDLDEELEASFGTADDAHPGVAARRAQGDHLLAGEVRCLREPVGSFPQYDLTPAQARARFSELQWKTVVGFQTRNPVHRAHEYLHKVALETVDGLFLQPLVGDTKGDDISASVRMRCYEALLKGYYPAGRVVLGTYPAAMRYAGPREAVLHAIVRRNYGCTHFIVGRDHAGVGNYYGTYDAQRLVCSLDQAELGIIPIPFEHTFFCRTCAQMASPRTCPHGDDERTALSGSAVREMLRRGELLPPEFSRPEVSRILVEAMGSTAG